MKLSEKIFQNFKNATPNWRTSVGGILARDRAYDQIRKEEGELAACMFINSVSALIVENEPQETRG